MSLPDLLKDVNTTAPQSDHSCELTSVSSLPLDKLTIKPSQRAEMSSQDSGLAGGASLRAFDGAASRSDSYDETRSNTSFGSCDSLCSFDEGEASWDALGRMNSIRRSNRFDKPQLLTVEIMKTEKGFGIDLEGEKPPVIKTVLGCAADTAIKAGDRLLEVNGESVKQMNHQDALSLIAQESSSVILLVQTVKPPPVPSGKVVFSGWLNKRGGTGMTPRNWRRRWFVIRDDCIAYYYSSPDETVQPLGAIVMHGYTISKASGDLKKPHSFKAVKGGSRTYYFACDSEDSMHRWAQVFTEAAGLENREEVRILKSSQNVSVSALSIKTPDCHGFLRKQESGLRGWKRRYCVLKNCQLFLYGNMSNTTAYGVINIEGFEICRGKTKDKRYYFHAVPPSKDSKMISFYADYDCERERWVEALTRSQSRQPIRKI